LGTDKKNTGKKSAEKQIRQLLRRASRFQERRFYQEAITLVEQAYTIALEQVSQKHPLFEQALDTLSGLHYDTGNYKQAEPLYIQLLALREQNLGKCHPLVATNMNNLGTLYQEAGNYTQAEPLLQQALEIRRTQLGENHADVAQSLDNLASVYREMGRYSEAEQLYQQALPIWLASVGETHPDVAICLHNLGLLYYKMGRYAEAEPLYKQALSINVAHVVSDPADLANSLNSLALLYKAKGDYQQAEALYQQILTLQREILGNDHSAVGLTLNNLASLYQDIGNYLQAEAFYQQARAILSATLGENHPLTSQCINNQASLYMMMGDYTQAERLYSQRYTTTSDTFGEDHPIVAQIAINLGSLYYQMGDYAQAEVFYRRGLAALRRTLGNTHPAVATALHNLGSFYRSIGDYTQSESLCQEALAIRRLLLGNAHPEVAQSLSTLALLSSNMGNYPQAEEFYQQALEILRVSLGENHPDVANALGNLGTCYAEQDNYTQAGALYQRALDIRRLSLGEKHRDVGNSLANLALLSSFLKDYTLAESYYQQTLDIWRTSLGENHPDVATVLSNLAVLYIATERKDKALALMQRSSAIYNQMIEQIFSISSDNQRMFYLGMIKGHFDAFLSLVLLHFPHTLHAVQSALDFVLRRKAIVTESLAARRDAILRGHYPDLAPQLQELNTLCMQIASRTLHGPSQEETSEQHQQLLDEWYAHRGWLESYLAHRIPEMQLTEQLRLADRRAVASALPPQSVLIEFIRINVMNFQPDSARTEARWTTAHYLAFVMKSDITDNVQLIDLGDAHFIEQEIAAFKVAITGESQRSTDRDLFSTQLSFPSQMSEKRSFIVIEEGENEAAYICAGKTLRTRVFDPLLSALGERVQLFLVPDGDLTLLPFEALPTEDGHYLIDTYQIIYLSVGRDALRFNAPNTVVPAPALVIADPDFDLKAAPTSSTTPIVSGLLRRWDTEEIKRSITRFTRLQGTRAEGQQIANLLNVSPLLDDKALEATVKACRSPRILHIATHGFFLPDKKQGVDKSPSTRGAKDLAENLPDNTKQGRLQGLLEQHIENPLLRSCLVLAGVNTWDQDGELPPEAEDGLLTAEDVTALDLLNTELVVLSACETGLGTVYIGEGVFGLRRAFMLAGAKRLVMSLWKVPDRQTEEFMVHFYQHLLEGHPNAFREAQLTMKRNYPHPFVWSAFIYQGDFNPLSR
jgi:tetratricopeptide (TPR) repeat protein/CHAT domain-containing protein